MWEGDALNSFLVTQSLKGLIEFYEKGQGFTGAYQENFERMRTPEKLGQKCYGENYWDPFTGKKCLWIFPSALVLAISLETVLSPCESY